jgi:hypothetical protein
MPLFKIFIIFNNHTYSTIINSFNLRNSPRPAFLNPVAFCSEAVDMNGIFQMQGGKNWILPK